VDHNVVMSGAFVLPCRRQSGVLTSERMWRGCL